MPGIGGYPLDLQEESEWCWAAVSQSVARFFDPQSGLKQCDIAAQVTNQPGCCGNIRECNAPARLTDALPVALAGKPSGASLKQVVSRPLRFDELQRELDAGRPVCIRIGWDGGGGHFIVLTGYQVLSSGDQHVDVADPLYPDCTVDYDELTNAYHGDGQWTHSFLLDVPKGA
jgi:hypothetical protein